LNCTFSHKAMKTFIILSILCLIFAYPAKAQVVVTGHVTAEIVDAASISPQGVYALEIDKTPDFTNSINYDDVLLGEVTVRSGSDVACNIVVKPATVSGSEGELLTMETSLNQRIGEESKKLNEWEHTDGDQTLQLTGNVNTLRKQQSGLYEGSYTVVFAYN